MLFEGLRESATALSVKVTRENEGGPKCRLTDAGLEKNKIELYLYKAELKKQKQKNPKKN